MFTLALLLALSTTDCSAFTDPNKPAPLECAQPPVVVCIGFTGAPCDITYATTKETKTAGDDLRGAVIQVTRDQDGHYLPSDPATARKEFRRSRDIFFRQVQLGAEQRDQRDVEHTKH
jgi:hypothetical protein